jgi:hypothetical protein
LAKGKVTKEAIAALSKTKFARGAGIAGGAKVAEEAVSNPYAQAALGAAEGAALGAALGPWGAAGGAVAGGLLGFVLADGERIVPVDMIAIPAYQYASVLQGREPTFQVFIKEGECIKPVMPTDYEMAGQIVMAEEIVATKPKRKLSKWQKYIKVKKNQIKFKNGKLDLKKMGRAYRRENSGRK